MPEHIRELDADFALALASKASNDKPLLVPIGCFCSFCMQSVRDSIQNVSTAGEQRVGNVWHIPVHVFGRVGDI